MSVNSEFLQMSPPGLDYMITAPDVLGSLFSLEFYKECDIVSVFRSRGEFVHYF
jgi:hypothetical protein